METGTESNKTIRMLHDYVLVQVQEEQEKTSSSGIIIALEGKDQPCTGVVISVGPGKIDNKGVIIEHGIQVGDNIFFAHSALTQKINIYDTNYYVLKAEQIWGSTK